MAETADPIAIFDKRKAISAILPYAIRLAGGGQQRMVDVFSRVARASNSGEFMWHCVEPLVVALFDEPNTPSPDRVITLVSPYLNWGNFHFDQNIVTRWSTAALATLAVPYTEEVGRSVVDTLLRIMPVGSLRRYIPVSIWSWSNNEMFLPPAWLGAQTRKPEVVRQVRAVGDTEILKSYLLLVWLEWGPLEDAALTEMCILIREDFNGIGMGHHREDLRKRLDHVLGQLNQGWEYINRHRPDLRLSNTEIANNQYGELMRVLVEVDREAV